VNDFAGVLTPETKQSLEELCTEVDQKAHAQIAVVTVAKMEADPVKGMKAGDELPALSIEEFATALEDKWKVGTKGTDRCVLLIVSLDPRKYRFELGGICSRCFTPVTTTMGLRWACARFRR
jgi:uncharacterized protein